MQIGCVMQNFLNNIFHSMGGAVSLYENSQDVLGCTVTLPYAQIMARLSEPGARGTKMPKICLWPTPLGPDPKDRVHPWPFSLSQVSIYVYNVMSANLQVRNPCRSVCMDKICSSVISSVTFCKGRSLILADESA